MFGFDRDEDGSHGRWVERNLKSKVTKVRRTSWWLIHNCVAHPLIGVAPVKAFFSFHDYTSRKIHE